MKRQTLLLGFVLLTLAATAQQSPYAKFGKITAADLEKKAYAVDSSAKAVILADIGSAEIIGNDKGSFSYVFKHHRVVHILDKSAYDLADVTVDSYRGGGMEDKFEKFKAVTYNMENGKLVETLLDKSGVFKEQFNKYVTRRKFTLPNVKEGCIIEYEYQTTSDFYHRLEPWAFQGNYPRLWSEYSIQYPYFFNYAVIDQGYLPFTVSEQDKEQKSFLISDGSVSVVTGRSSFVATVLKNRWAIKDVPELKKEAYTSAIRNHVQRMEFQLSEYREPLQYKRLLKMWPEVTAELRKDEDFGAELSKRRGWAADLLKEIAPGTDKGAAARKIYNFLRDGFSCTDHDALYISQPLKSTAKARKGNVADINLMLTALLQEQGIPAEPVILSTRENGYIHDFYALLNRFNYVICRAEIDGKTVMLDASRPRLGFGRLPEDCYNGPARIIAEQPEVLNLYADSLTERKLTSVFVSSAKDKFEVNLRQQNGYLESMTIRNAVKEKGQEAFFTNLKKHYTTEISLLEPGIDSIDNYDVPVSLHYKFDLGREDDDVIYFNPMFAEGYKENPFKAASRIYPVEMPHATDETMLVTLHIPEGYTVDELPKSVRVMLNEQKEGMFEYLISFSGSTVSMRTRLKLDRAIFAPEEYDLLREFFNLVVSKHSEQIVLKKKAKP